MTLLRIALSAVVIAGCGLAIMRASAPDPYSTAKKPGSSLIEVSAPLVVSASTGSAISTDPNGVQVRMPCNFVPVLTVTSAPTGGSPSLTAYFQHSADDGNTWQDFATVSTTSTGTYYVPVSSAASGHNLINLVNFETDNFSQCASETNANIVTSPVLDGVFVQLNRSSSVANVEIRANGTTYYTLPTAYYRFLFQYTSNPSEGGICNFQDNTSTYKCTCT